MPHTFRLQGTRLFDYKNVVVRAKDIIMKASEKKQSFDLEKVLDKIKQQEEKLSRRMIRMDEKIDEMSRNINEKLDRLLQQGYSPVRLSCKDRHVHNSINKTVYQNHDKGFHFRNVNT